MPHIFSNQAGRVAQVDGLSLPMNLRIASGRPGLYASFRGFSGFKSVITGIALAESSGHQILHTLNQFIYIYSFGERVGDLVVTGVGFLADCADRTDEFGFLDKMTGLEHILEFYRVNRFSTTGQPMYIVIGTTQTLIGFLTDIKIELTDPSTQVAQFMMRFKYPPRHLSAVGGPSSDNWNDIPNNLPVQPVITTDQASFNGSDLDIGEAVADLIAREEIGQALGEELLIGGIVPPDGFEGGIALSDQALFGGVIPPGEVPIGNAFADRFSPGGDVIIGSFIFESVTDLLKNQIEQDSLEGRRILGGFVSSVDTGRVTPGLVAQR